MSNAIEICNLALAKLGDRAQVVSIDPPDDSVQAQYCSIFYDPTLTSVLIDTQWSFAVKVAELAEVTNDDSRFAYAYALPSDCLLIHSVFETGVATTYQGVNQAQFSVAQGVLYTDQASASIEYTFNQRDPVKFSALFVDALSWKLAANLSGVIIKGDTGASAAMKLMQAYASIIKLAKESDGRTRLVRPNYQPEGIRSRA